MKRKDVLRFFHDLINQICIIVILLDKKDDISYVKDDKQKVSQMISQSAMPDEFIIFLEDHWMKCDNYHKVMEFCRFVQFYQLLVSSVVE